MVKFRINYLDWFENVIFSEVVKMTCWNSAEDYAVKKSKEIKSEEKLIDTEVKLIDIVQI